MPTLYLTDAEKTLFEALPADVRSHVSVEAETLTFTDSEEHCASRMRNLHLKDPTLKKFQDEAKTKTYSADELVAMAETIDLSSLSKDDVVELAFAWGPDVFTTLIREALPLAKSAQYLQEMADLTDLRHGLLLSFNR